MFVHLRLYKHIHQQLLSPIVNSNPILPIYVLPQVEKMEGDNQYRAEQHGKQDAVKGTRFLSFPDVLQLQLKRFEYDPYQDQMVKVSLTCKDIHSSFAHYTFIIFFEFWSFLQSWSRLTIVLNFLLPWI